MGSEATEGRYVPLIDMSDTDVSISTKLHHALTTVGFACLTNTDVWTTADDYGSMSREFFELPEIEKQQYSCPMSSSDIAGWVHVGREQLTNDRPGDYREGFLIMPYIKDDRSRLPAVLDNDKCWNLWNSFEELATRVLNLIGLGLGLDDTNFLASRHHFSDHAVNPSAQRINWYPKIDPDKVKPGQIRCGEHSDYGSITLLYCNSPGLQVVNRETGNYVDAGYVEGGIFVNVGDMLQMWSGDVLLATKHRVLIPDEKYLQDDRVSIAFFCQPDSEEVIQTLNGSHKYPPVIAGEWLAQRFQATFDK